MPTSKQVWSAAAPVLGFVGVVLLWEVGVRIFQVPSFLLPTPSEIARESWAVRGQLATNTLATLRTVALGFAASVAISFPLAFLIASSRTFAATIYPMLVVTQSVPKVAVAPILVVAFGAGELSRTAVTVLVAFFPLVLSVSTGLVSVPPELVELGRSLQASRMQMMIRIRLPFAIPFIFSGLKLSITLALVGAVVGEFVAAERGLGYQIISATAFFRTPIAFGALVLLSLLGIVLFQITALVERLAFPWSVPPDAKV
jgi:NitT/TauT family transport system permease protein